MIQISLRWIRTIQSGHLLRCITKTGLFKYIENFTFKYIENSTSKNWKFSDKNSYNFYISAQNIDCVLSLEPPRTGGSNEYTKSMFSSRNKKNNVYPCKPQFYDINWGFRVGGGGGGSKLYRHVFVTELRLYTVSEETKWMIYSSSR